MNNTRQITITDKRGVIPSKFGAVQKKVYILPSINDCLILLPKDISNYILSFTSAFIELYLENVAKQNGIKFVISVFYDELKIKRIKKVLYHSVSDIISKFINESILTKINIKQIKDVFDKRIAYEKIYCLNSKQERLIEKTINSTILLNQIIKSTYMNRIYSEFTNYYICIKKLAYQYYLLPITLEKDYDNGYLIYPQIEGYRPSVEILLNRSFEVYELLPIKPLICRDTKKNITKDPQLFTELQTINTIMWNFGCYDVDRYSYRHL